MPSIQIKHRFTGAILFECELDAEIAGKSLSLRLGFAVKQAVASRADLSGANLSRADLSGADLSGANLSRTHLSRADLSGADLSGADLWDADLSGANLVRADLAGANLAGANLARADLIDGGQRSDGYRFVGWIRDDGLMIRAGCRNFSISDARAHWAATRGGTPLGAETMAILDHIETVARIRGLVSDGAAMKERG